MIYCTAECLLLKNLAKSAKSLISDAGTILDANLEEQENFLEKLQLFVNQALKGAIVSNTLSPTGEMSTPVGMDVTSPTTLGEDATEEKKEAENEKRTNVQKGAILSKAISSKLGSLCFTSLRDLNILLRMFLTSSVKIDESTIKQSTKGVSVLDADKCELTFNPEMPEGESMATLFENIMTTNNNSTADTLAAQLTTMLRASDYFYLLNRFGNDKLNGPLTKMWDQFTNSEGITLGHDSNSQVRTRRMTNGVGYLVNFLVDPEALKRVATFRQHIKDAAAAAGGGAAGGALNAGVAGGAGGAGGPGVAGVAGVAGAAGAAGELISDFHLMQVKVNDVTYPVNLLSRMTVNNLTKKVESSKKKPAKPALGVLLHPPMIRRLFGLKN